MATERQRLLENGAARYGKKGNLFCFVQVFYAVLEDVDGSRLWFCFTKQIFCLALAPWAGVEGHGEGMHMPVVAGGLDFRIAWTMRTEVVTGPLLDVKSGGVVKDIFLIGDNPPLLRLMLPCSPTGKYSPGLCTNGLDVTSHFRGLGEVVGIIIRFPNLGKIHAGHSQNNAEVGVGQGTFDGVSTLQYADIGVEEAVEPGITLGSEIHIGDWVGVMVVLSGGIDNEFRFKFVKYRHDYAVHDHVETFIAGVRWQGDVDGIPFGGRSPRFMEKTAARIKGSAVLMQGNKEGVGIIVEYILGAVAVMAIGVDYSNFPHPVVTADVFNHNRFDIDDAKAAVAKDRLHGMVTGWTDDGKGLLRFFFHDCASSPKGTAGGYKMRFSEQFLGRRHTKMNPIDIMKGCQFRIEKEDILNIFQTFFDQLISGIEEAFLTLRMIWADAPVKGRKEDQSGFVQGVGHIGWHAHFLKWW